ncbi:MAG: hypothetical protein HKM96_11010 [Boseongicola sp.]|nr:hypothetical protein [Silicimonas sp.]NNF91908.1 hypothetical protein [Boseongicola sp.]
MQDPSLEDFHRNVPPANDPAAQHEPVQALSRAISPLSGLQLETLEDELDFYAFTGLMGPLMKKVLSSVADTPTAAKLSDRADFRHSLSAVNSELFCLAS